MVQILDKEYWENRYKARKTDWDLGQISPPIKAIVTQLEITHAAQKNLKILIPGAGMGYEAIYLFQKGFKNTTVLDLAQQPLNAIADACPEFPKEQLIQTNFFEFEQTGFDLVLEQTFFCALSPNLRVAYKNKMHQLLKPKGILTGVLFQFPLTHLGPPFGGSLLEYIALFESTFSIKFIETAHNSVKSRAGKELFFIFENK